MKKIFSALLLAMPFSLTDGLRVSGDLIDTGVPTALVVASFAVPGEAIESTSVVATDSVATADFFASPTGSGNCLSARTPCLIATAMALLSPGKILTLADGVYTGSGSMISPPAGLKGNSLAPITIRATNDGQVLIDGQNTRQPIGLLNDNDWFVIEGINARNSNNDGVEIGRGSDNNIIRRVVSWDASLSGNHSCMSIHGGVNNLFEDVAAFGTCRKVFSFSQSGRSNSTIRRAWGAWTRSTRADPKMTFSIAYNSYGNRLENVIGTWKEENSDSPTGGRHGILGNDQMFNGIVSADKCSNGKILGSIAYHRANDALIANYSGVLQSSTTVDCLDYEHIAAYEGAATPRTAALNNLSVTHGGPSSGNHRLTRVTRIGGSAATIGSDWTQSGNASGATVASVPNIWNGDGAIGARVCKRYNNGVLTSEPLWPWPMDQRIKDALNASGRTAADYFRGDHTPTGEMEAIFGAIPAECRTR